MPRVRKLVSELLKCEEFGEEFCFLIITFGAVIITIQFFFIPTGKSTTECFQKFSWLLPSCPPSRAAATSLSISVPPHPSYSTTALLLT